MTVARRLGVSEALSPTKWSTKPQPGATGAGSAARLALAVLVAAALFGVACGGDDSESTTAPESGQPTSSEPFVIGAIPDQDPEQLQRLYGTVADYLSERLDVEVEYRPVTDYAASVSLFRAGDLDMVWFGGLTGVQARLQVDGADAILQRDVDERFRSVFVVNTSTAIEPFDSVDGLSVLEGRRFTFGSESSTSGRLMPQYFLDQAGVEASDFAGEPGFSGSHDKTIELVASGSFEAGALNEQVWDDRVADGAVDADRVEEVFRTPGYHDYHWVIRPDVAERYGEGFVDEVKGAFLGLDPGDPTEKQILDLFTAERFIETDNDNYGEIEEIGRELGLVS